MGGSVHVDEAFGVPCCVESFGVSGGGLCGGGGVYGYCSAYVVWPSMCLGSFLCRLRVMGAGFSVSVVRTDWRVSVMIWWLRSAKAFSLAMR